MPAQFEADPDNVFSMAFGLNINQKKIKKMEKEYKTMKSKENEDEVEIRVSNFNSFFWFLSQKTYRVFFYCSALKMTKYKEKLKYPNCFVNCSSLKVLSVNAQ